MNIIEDCLCSLFWWKEMIWSNVRKIICHSGFRWALESNLMLHYYLEINNDVDVTMSHPHHTFTDNLAARMLSSLTYNLVANGLLNLVLWERKVWNNVCWKIYHTGFRWALESSPMLHNKLENEWKVDMTMSHPPCTFTDNLAAGLLSSLPYNLIVNNLLNLVY